jgi:pyruvate/2-oxoglutarate dehydrogenase complex dihydrolipoamide acyltransferase (E2) component
MRFSLTFDNRAIDGSPAARFLMDVVQLIEKPDLR